MASFVMLGGRGSSMRTWSTRSLHASILPSCSLNLPLLLHSQTQLQRASHFSCAQLVLTTVRPSFSFSSSPSSVVQESPSEDYPSGEDSVPIFSPKFRSAHRKFPLLSPKEKKDLRAYAHSLGKKIISQQIGKAGVTESLAKAISDALEAKEIVKLKVLDNCPDELEVVVSKIEEATQGQVVGKIGSVIILYRPSLRKLSEAGRSQNKFQEGPPRRTMGRRV